MLSERFTNPYILTFVCTDKQNEVIPGGIIGVEEIRDYAQQAETTRNKNKFILFAQLFEDVLLEFL